MHITAFLNMKKNAYPNGQFHFVSVDSHGLHFEIHADCRGYFGVKCVVRETKQ